MKTAHEQLKEARALIADPANWTTGSYARASWPAGISVDPSGPSAQCWCSVGALAKVTGIDRRRYQLLVMHLGTAMAEDWHLVDHDVIGFNDSHNHKEVLALFDSAIKKTAPKDTQ